MKLSGGKEDALVGNNRAWLDKHLGDKDAKPEELNILLLIADMLDLIAKNNNIWMTIGSTKNRSSFVITIQGDLGKGAVYGLNLADLGKATLDLL